jgi:hypothetical protein
MSARRKPSSFPSGAVASGPEGQSHLDIRVCKPVYNCTNNDVGRPILTFSGRPRLSRPLRTRLPAVAAGLTEDHFPYEGSARPPGETTGIK